MAPVEISDDNLVIILRDIQDKLSKLCAKVAQIEQYHDDQDSHKGDKQWGWERFFGIAATMGLAVTLVLTQL